ncbi:MAG TPA: DNA polymerase domain-containing protein [Syntrophomonadaceae bacterium]|nr:DNA polymerase domain-containing protein [Syntrophomonadaceae bacterium]
MKTAQQVEVAGKTIALSRLEKILWPQPGYTKADLIFYYHTVAPFILPHLQDRPLVFTRYPDGIEGKYFYQKNAPEYTPAWFRSYLWKSPEGSENRLLMVEDAAGLVWCANQACIEIHPWISRIQSIECPDYIVFDLDPSPGSKFQDVVNVALQLKNMLADLGLRSYPKTSGAMGLHIYLPVEARYPYKTLREFARVIAEAICSLLPEIATVERAVSCRGNKIYVDYLQNVMGKTICAPYSIRPRPDAPVSTPLEWKEVKDVQPDRSTIKTILERLQNKGDLFAAVLDDRQSLDRWIKVKSPLL